MHSMREGEIVNTIYIIILIVLAHVIPFVFIGADNRISRLRKDTLAKAEKDLDELRLQLAENISQRQPCETINSNAIGSTITVSPDGVKIESDKLSIGMCSNGMALSFTDRKSHAPRRTNCPNCGAALAENTCRYCGTRV